MNRARASAIARENAEIEASQSRAIAAREANENRPRTALEAMAQRLKVSPQTLQNTLKSTVFSACRNNEEFVALVVVANEYGLNPLLKEIYAFPAKGGGIVPMVSIDGWIRIMNEHPQFDGIEFDHIVDEKGNLVAIEAVIYRKDRNHPIKVVEYLDENKRGTEPWKMMPSRMLRHRALIQGARIAFGFSGVVSEGDEIELVAQPMPAPALPSAKSLAEELDDEIPAFDGKTGEQVDADTGEIRTDSRGMTEVDEETARQLDRAGEGEPDGEAADYQSPADQALANIKAQIGAAKNVKGLAAVEAEWVNKHRIAFDDETAAEVDRLFVARKRDLSGEGGE